MSTLLGTLLNDRYRLEARIGTGGMSTVYRALDETLERQVAIKLMNREIASDSDQLERFRREARAVAQLSHPHIVGVIDAGEDHGRPYIVFEYVEGETLKERIRRLGQLPVGEAVAYAIEIARALGAAHARHIVHRDVKPQNVLIDEEGSAKVTDFGIARTLDEDGLTQDGRVLGTTDYVSPEQALGHDVSGQSDLYSLGVVLYEMLTGQVPFRGENQVAVAMQHVREEIPDVRVLRPEASASLAAVIDRATAKDLRDRYRSDEELIADLEDVLALETARSGSATGEATAVIRTLPRRARKRVPLRVRRPEWIALLALVAVIAAIAVIVLVVLRGERGTGTSGERATGVGREGQVEQLREISLKSDGARDYDPEGDRTEHAEETAAAVDKNPSTFWSTETYEARDLQKDGVGLTVDVSPGAVLRRMVVKTPTPGFTAEVYITAGDVPESIDDPAWRRVAAATRVGAKQAIDLDSAGQEARHVLLWITALPPGGDNVKISEIQLYR
ncbi:protein kinase [Conexibacter sp. JD483]|uniref:protein kinase domain-containing protein n=1 Tax=unclassified Conexibacter TaxID=2627773 RepID=UPI002721B47B|nr:MULTISPECIES: protein kinase [unclassified Conexibacter]MDO8184471.1 protein kinase [Conexibacter sp. CPCC 205706]MDO8197777.1 protein kinase [Conexibacter sp. CPCC 205762]MDR9368087.1 protein kinase [Conexibacter sp. JD483]